MNCFTKKVINGSLCLQTPGKMPGRMSRSFSPKEGSLAFEPNTNSFEAFTHTVEALALQKSVIGQSLIRTGAY